MQSSPGPSNLTCEFEGIPFLLLNPKPPHQYIERGRQRRWVSLGDDLAPFGRSREWAGTREGRHQSGQALDSSLCISFMQGGEHHRHRDCLYLLQAVVWFPTKHATKEGPWIGWSYMGSCSFLHREKNRWDRGFPLAPPHDHPAIAILPSMLILSSTQNAQPSSISEIPSILQSLTWHLECLRLALEEEFSS